MSYELTSTGEIDFDLILELTNNLKDLFNIDFPADKEYKRLFKINKVMVDKMNEIEMRLKVLEERFGNNTRS